MSSLLLAKILSTIFARSWPVCNRRARRSDPCRHSGRCAGWDWQSSFSSSVSSRGPEFVAEAAPYALGGLAATLCLNLAYWRFSSLVHRYRFVTAVIAAVSGFLVAAWGDRQARSDCLEWCSACWRLRRCFSLRHAWRAGDRNRRTHSYHLGRRRCEGWPGCCRRAGGHGSCSW